MVILDQKSVLLQVIAATAFAATGIDIIIAYADGLVSTDPTLNMSLVGYLTTRVSQLKPTAITTILQGADNTNRVIKEASFYNSDSSSHEITVKIKDSKGTVAIGQFVVAAGKTLLYSESQSPNWQVTT